MQMFDVAVDVEPDSLDKLLCREKVASLSRHLLLVA